jgi:hypothetical protein
MEIPVHPEKRLLVCVARIFGRSQQIQGKPQHTLVIALHQPLESVFVSILRRPDQCSFIHLGARPGAHRGDCLTLSVQDAPFPV